MPGKYYITTAIDYVNSPPHIGTAYEKISADVFARFRQAPRGRRLLPDGHGRAQPERAALRQGEGHGPARVLRRDGGACSAACGRSSRVEFDRFIRTTERDHVVGLTKLFEAIKDDIYQGHYEGYYCESCEAFLQEKDLEDGCCPTHGTEPEWIKEENYFFRLSSYAEPAARAHRDATPSSFSRSRAGTRSSS